MKMYQVSFAWTGTAYISELDVKKVTDKTVVTSCGVRYLKKCQGYELFDSFDIAKNCAITHTREHIESLERRLAGAKKDLEMLLLKTNS